MAATEPSPSPLTSLPSTDGLPRARDGYDPNAVADAFETLQIASPNRPPFSPWSALEEIERGSGQTFGSEVVKALRKVAAAPEPLVTPLSLSSYRDRVANN